MSQQFFRRSVVRQLAAAEQLIARYRALLLVLIFHIQLQQCVGADVPVECHRGKIALAIGVLDVRVDVFVGNVGPQAELLFAAEPAAHIGGDVTATAIVGRHGNRTHIGGPLGHVINRAAGLGDAALQA